MKNINRILLLSILMILCFSTSLFAADYSIKDYRINATVNNNGSISVVEYLKYYFDEDMNGLYRDILYNYRFSNQENNMKATSSRYQSSGVDNINVYTSDVSFDNMEKASIQPEVNLSNGMNHVYSVTDYTNDGYRTKIKVYSPVNSNTYKYVKYEYTIKDAIVNYNNYSEFYWNFLGKDWECDISNLNINVKLPVSSDIHTFGHTYAKIDSFNNIGNEINMKVSNISEGTAVDIRAVFPNTYITNVGNITKNISQNYDFNELNNIENQMTVDKQKYDLSNKIWVGYAILMVIIVIYLIKKAADSRNKNLKGIGKVDYYTDILNTKSLGEFSCIRNKYYGYSDPNLVVATILDLSDRKYIKLESLKKAKFLKDTYEYYVSADTTKDLNKLNDFEKELLNYIFNKKLSNEIDITEFEGNRIELNERFKELSLDYMLGAKYRKSCSDKTTEIGKIMYNPVPSSVWKSLGYSVLISILVAAINIMFVSPLTDKLYMFVPIVFINLFVFGMLTALVSAIAKSLKDEYTDEYNRLLGLQKYLKDYSVIKQRYPIEIALWGKYLVFASLFGIADKVSKEFKEELLSQGYDENYIYTTYPIIHMGINSNSFTASAASMSGSSSSGGYSGGGGGGGGRRWRRRRCLLT